MLAGQPPRNAAHRLTLVSEKWRVRAAADVIVESYDERASTRPAY
jgi:hypothetical protein